MVVEFIQIIHRRDAITGINGQHISPNNPPAYLAGDLDEVRQVGIHYCCDGMKMAVENGIIEFGSRMEEAYHNKLKDVFIRVEDGAQVLPCNCKGPCPCRTPKPNTDLALAYCPFCTMPVLTYEIEYGCKYTQA